MIRVQPHNRPTQIIMPNMSVHVMPFSCTCAHVALFSKNVCPVCRLVGRLTHYKKKKKIRSEMDRLVEELRCPAVPCATATQHDHLHRHPTMPCYTCTHSQNQDQWTNYSAFRIMHIILDSDTTWRVGAIAVRHTTHQHSQTSMQREQEADRKWHNLFSDGGWRGYC